ncbi:MAG: DUF1801 domain-containing protein [Bacteroidetes bacterium]|nr:MAG: DUF1801 domain-containing protein [Bacteroidota bacterium]
MTITDYLKNINEDKKSDFLKLRNCIIKNIPQGFEETMSYGMIGFVVPHKLYPTGYHCDPKLPLPFISIAAQKNFIALYHMGIYCENNLLDWFVNEYPKHTNQKLDMGKSCIRFKKPDQIPYKLIEELVTKIDVKQWIELYEANFKR